MDGTNSAGRKVSLLNDHEPPHPQLVRLASFAHSVHSEPSSYDSSPIGTPPTPQLVRSTSSDSTNMQSPSPITPDYAYETGLESPVFAQSSFFPSQKDSETGYAHLPSQVSLPYHPAQPGYYSQQQPPPPPPPPPSAAAHVNGRPKKNSYPCPMAKAYQCHDYFTTSGHAARHAKKHTGKKDAFCPECNKAFTRKDNMEQHRRTHQSGRSSAKSGDRDAKRARTKANVRPPISPLQSTKPEIIRSSSSAVDPSLPVSPTGSYTTAGQQSDSFLEYPRQYPDPTTAYQAYTTGPYIGLDALAIAASGEKRKFHVEGEEVHQ